MVFEVPRDYKYPGVPDSLMPGIKLWVEEGVKPGSFLQAVISNDLARAVQQADWESLPALKPLVDFIHNYLPASCHGPKALETWRGTRHYRS